jgi:hypothetical protein
VRRLTDITLFRIAFSYDVYTPTQNIVFHDYQPTPGGHGAMEWMRPRMERFRRAGIQRIKSYLGLPGGIEGLNLSNLGIYGLGKRRSIQQMAKFVGIEMETQKSRPQSVRFVLLVIAFIFVAPFCIFIFIVHPSNNSCRVVMMNGCPMTPTFLPCKTCLNNPTIWIRSPSIL